ncbi:GGDEF domain-containing protein [Thaumasiovibrio subtropicus]|uniref:GGDEF domain-containing protein n=1 Tax=Thaumasiovibrio subtropicus TaxID=1891207 RepID=UPI00131BF021|nr:GGDEF domain-containing protein [Thaumasiovibrio subtropicus]
MLDVEIIKVATIVNNVTCSIIGCLFLYIVSRDIVGNKKHTAICFLIFFLLYGAAFATLAMRQWVSLGYSVVLNNFLYHAAGYMFYIGVRYWFSLPVSRRLVFFASLHVVMFTCVQTLMWQWQPDALYERVVINVVSYSAINAQTLYVLNKYRNKQNMGESILLVCMIIVTASLYLPLIMLSFNYDPVYFVSGIIINQNMMSFLLLGSMLSLFLLSEIEWHYRRSICDELSKLYNRRYFNENIDTQVKQNPKGINAIAMLDIDHFKVINDTFGHDAGDRVIVTIANLMRAHIHPNELAARYGGEEFVMSLNAKTQGELASRLERLNKAIAETEFVFDKVRVNVTVSIGVAMVEKKQPILVVREADKALYAAKKSGRACVRYQSEHLKMQPERQAAPF